MIYSLILCEFVRRVACNLTNSYFHQLSESTVKKISSLMRYAPYSLYIMRLSAHAQPNNVSTVSDASTKSTSAPSTPQ